MPDRRLIIFKVLYGKTLLYELVRLTRPRFCVRAKADTEAVGFRQIPSKTTQMTTGTVPWMHVVHVEVVERMR